MMGESCGAVFLSKKTQEKLGQTKMIKISWLQDNAEQ
jgi:hypothetical protein